MNTHLKIVAALFSCWAAIPSHAAVPTTTLSSPASGFAILGSTVNVAGIASDADGNMVDHWLEVQRPNGDWSWGGWLTTYPFEGSLNGSSSSSNKSGNVTLNDLGTYNFRSTASDDYATYSVSNYRTLEVVLGYNISTTQSTSYNSNYIPVKSVNIAPDTVIGNAIVTYDAANVVYGSSGSTNSLSWELKNSVTNQLITWGSAPIQAGASFNLATPYNVATRLEFSVRNSQPVSTNRTALQMENLVVTK